MVCVSFQMPYRSCCESLVLKNNKQKCLCNVFSNCDSWQARMFTIDGEVRCIPSVTCSQNDQKQNLEKLVKDKYRQKFLPSYFNKPALIKFYVNGLHIMINHFNKIHNYKDVDCCI